MLDLETMNLRMNKIEEIESYYLSVISKYVGADINGFIKRLESHNRTWNYWYHKSAKKGSHFDTGSERVVYMLMNRGDILGEPNADPIGSDNSYLKYDETFSQYLVLNIDVKTIKANTALNDIINNVPVGINQNSYECNIEYRSGNRINELRHYSPNLETIYKIKDYHNVEREYLSLSFEIIILYEQLPIGEIPQEDKVIGIFTVCIPNGLLRLHYGNRIFDAGKTSGLTIKKDQEILLPEGLPYITKGNENLEKLCKINHITKDEYYTLNGNRCLNWDLDARFSYKRNSKFELIPGDKTRIRKLFLKENEFEKLFYYVDKNLVRTRRIRRLKSTVDAFEFLIELNTE